MPSLGRIRLEDKQWPENEHRRKEPRGLGGHVALTLRDTVAPARSLSWGSVGRLRQMM